MADDVDNAKPRQSRVLQAMLQLLPELLPEELNLLKSRILLQDKLKIVPASRSSDITQS